MKVVTMLSLSNRRGITAVVAALILALLAIVAPATKANATGGSFEISYDRFQSGELVEFRAVSPAGFCPYASPYSTVYAKITDSTSAVVFETPVGIASGYSGEWNTRYATNVNIWSGGTGAMDLTLECRPYGGNGYVSMIHGTKTLEITPQTSQISNSEARVGKVTEFTSNDPCTAGAPVQMTIFGKVGYSNTDPNRPLLSIRTLNGTADANGNWAISETLDRTKYDPTQVYYARVTCDLGGPNEKKYDSYRFSMKDFEYVAMGDSYSSGLGAGNYNYNTYDPWDNAACKRSTSSYSFGVAREQSWSGPKLVACAGAVTDDIFNWANEMPQSDHLNGDTEKVTITIGGNDLKFDEVLRACSSSANAPGYGCSSDSTVVNKATSRLAALAGTGETPQGQREIHSIEAVLNKIAEQAPNADIYIGGYPKLFGSNSANYTQDTNAPGGYRCTMPGTSFAYEDTQWMNQIAADLNGTIKTAVDKVKLTGVKATYAPPIFFNGHGHCDSGDSLLHEVYLTPPPTLEVLPESFHPTYEGQWFGYENSFNVVMD